MYFFPKLYIEKETERERVMRQGIQFGKIGINYLFLKIKSY